jgi:DNA polymerase-3 subunit delta'
MLFKDVLVDDSLKKQLISLVKENRISHAQLFLAPAGSHAFALAVAYAQYICCENPSEDDSCGVCPSCAKFAKLSHPDFHLIFPNCTTTEVKKDPDFTKFSAKFRQFVFDHNYHIDINDWLMELGGENKQAYINTRDCAYIVNQNSIKSYEGGYKIYVLWSADRLYRDAAPKLLKTLEEPENKTLFILLTESTDKMLTTILSRTQLVKIPKLKTKVIQQQLVKDFNISENEAADVAVVADGNYNRALELMNDDSDYKECLNQVQLILNSMIALAQAMPNKAEVNYLEVRDCFDTIISHGREYQKNFLSAFIRILRAMLMKNSHQDAVCKASSTENAIVERYAKAFNLKNVSQIFDECNKTLYHIERNGNSSLVFTDWYLKVAELITPRP